MQGAKSAAVFFIGGGGTVNPPNGVQGQSPWKFELNSSLTGSARRASASTKDKHLAS